MEFLNTFFGKVLDWTAKPIGEHLGYVFFYSSNIDELEKEAKELKAKRNDVEELVVAARNNDEVIKETVQNWICSVDEITEQAEGFFKKETDADTGCSHWSYPNLRLRYELSKEAKQMTVAVGELNREGKFDRVSTHQKLPEGIGPSSVVKEAFESRVSTRNEIMKALADPTVQMIGLYGLPGVGKTTLAKQVAKNAEVKKLFDKVHVVEVKRYPIKEIQSQIADLVGFHFNMEGENESVRASRLRSRLQQEKSLLIVLDDLWKRLDFEEVGIPSADEADTHRKFILTSRFADLLSGQMKCQRNIEVRELSEQEAWVLFKEMAEIDEYSDDPDLVSKATEVSQKCARLPVAIVAVARALRNNKSLVDWKDALRRLNSYSSRNISGIEEVDSSIKLSYDYLRSKELKSTFLLSAMFSQDALITELFMYVVGLGFLEGVDSMEAARDRLDALINQLKASSLLLDSYSKNRFTIHDVVRDVALSIAFEEQHALVKRREKVDDWPNEYKPESCTAICLDESDIDSIPDGLYGPRVKFFYLKSKDFKLNIPNSFFDGMQELKVLSLSNMTFSSLPSSISLLNKLITLSLHSCTLGEIAVVEHLKKLKILNLSNSRIKQLPCKVGQLGCLRILNLSDCHGLDVIPPDILSNLKKLEELYMKGSFNQWEAKGLNEGKERASLDEIKHLKKLFTLEIDIPDASVLPKDLFLENSLERYKISIGITGWDDYNYEYSRTLRLQANNNINMEYGVFKLFESVEDLSLKNLNGIASLYKSHNTAQTFCKLRKIEVRHCDQLKSLLSVSMARTLSQLERIGISECKFLKEIVASTDEENVEKGSAMNVIELLQLRSLKLYNLPALTDFCFGNKVAFPKLENLSVKSINCRNIWDMFTSEIVESSQMGVARNGPLPDSYFSNLKILEVRGCHHLVKLIPLHILKSLNNLVELDIQSCDLLEMVFDFGESDNSCKERHSFPLETLYLEDLPKLKIVWGRSSQRIVCFQSLQVVSAHNCKSLEGIFPAYIAEDLVQLEELHISDCGTEFLVAEDEFPLDADASFVFPRLRVLSISNFDYISKIFQVEVPDAKVFPVLEDLKLKGKPAKMMWNGEFRAYHFPNVRFLYLQRIYDKAATFPYGLLYGFPKLERLKVESSSFKVIFSYPKRPLDNNARKAMSVKRLDLFAVEDLKHVWDGKCQLHHILQNLEALEVSSCRRLINLGPSFVSLENLTELDVSNCGELINLLTSSTARTLGQLTKLKIINCKKIEGIITKGEEDVENEIVFMKLKILELRQLPSCKSFCCHNHTFSFPSLDRVIITSCPKFRIFCPGGLNTPLLKGVEVEKKGIYGQDNKIYWQDNLNKTIQHLFEEEVSFCNVDVKIDEYPKLIDVWNGKLAPNHSLSSLTSLVMDKCGFLSDYVIPSYVLTSLIKLQSLQVSNCHKVEVVFDLKGMDIDKEAHTLQALPLSKLRLEHLPNLKYVWNKDLHTDHCFQHLVNVSAYECGRLRSIFPASIAKGLAKLNQLEIESCGVEVIVAEDQTPLPTTHFVFPRLWILDLIKLPNLKNFYPQRHTVKWPRLEYMGVIQCKKVKVFSWGDPNIREKEAEDGVENQYPLFLFEEVVPKINRLVLNQNHVKMISNGQFQDHIFKNVGILGLDSFYEDESLVFLYTFLERFTNLWSLIVSHSSFEDMFSYQGPASDPPRKVLASLVSLNVNHCSRLINLVPSSASFNNLRWLTVSSCHCLGYLLTTSTARSLVNLGILRIKDCKIMEEIVTNKDEDVEDKIVLKKLRDMELINLLDLKNFSSCQMCTFEFPSLMHVTIKGCSKMKMFCLGGLATPLLEDVKIEENEERWEENLNRTVEQLFLENITTT